MGDLFEATPGRRTLYTSVYSDAKPPLVAPGPVPFVAAFPIRIPQPKAAQTKAPAGPAGIAVVCAGTVMVYLDAGSDGIRPAWDR
jgi:hypothetical protein